MGESFSCGLTARNFAIAGNARITVVSQKTGARFTFRIQQRDIAAPHFVSVLTGADNEADYTYLGSIFQCERFAHGKKSRIGRDAPSARAFAWVWSYLSRCALPPSCDVWHEGSCGRCGRALTDPESIATGIGPTCAEKVAA